VERNRDLGIHVSGSNATVEATVVRDTLAQESDQGAGRAVNVNPAATTGERSTLVLRSCLLDQNRDVGVFVSGSDATVEGTIVRATQPQIFDQSSGRGLNVQESSTGQPANVTVRGSLVLANHDLGVYVQGSTTTLDGTVVRDTEPRASDGEVGEGLGVQDNPSTGQRGSAMVHWSVIEGNHAVGVSVIGADATLEGSIVRGTQPKQADLTRGRGIEVGDDPDTGQRASATLLGSIVEHNRDSGIFIHGSDAAIDKTIVRDTLPRLNDNTLGRGLQIQRSATDPNSSSRVALRNSSIERSFEFGVVVHASEATLEGVVVLDTAPSAANGTFGDGVTVISEATLASAVIRNSRIAASARVGVALFGGFVQLGSSTLDCNVIHLNGEDRGEQAFVLENLGENVCGCGSQLIDCKLTSTSLEAPGPLD
jgi:hypothetical protein